MRGLLIVTLAFLVSGPAVAQDKGKGGQAGFTVEKCMAQARKTGIPPREAQRRCANVGAGRSAVSR